METGGLRRIAHETTEDIEAMKIFQGIYGVGARPIPTSRIASDLPMGIQADLRRASGTTQATGPWTTLNRQLTVLSSLQHRLPAYSIMTVSHSEMTFSVGIAYSTITKISTPECLEKKLAQYSSSSSPLVRMPASHRWQTRLIDE